MKLEQMIKEVVRLVDDKYYDSITIQEYVNKALSMCSLAVDIPEFKRVGTVTASTSQAYVYLTEQITNFGGRVRRVKNDGTDLKIYSNLDAMLDHYKDMSESGEIEAVAVEGNFLWYAKIPETSCSLMILFFVNPEPLIPRSNDEITWMPEECQRKILVHGAASLIWGELEEEDSGQPMTKRYTASYYEGIYQFQQWISRNRQNLTYSHWSI